MHILLSPTLCKHYCDYVEKLTADWIRRSEQLYGKHFIVYNVHSLLHLVDDVRKFGNLDTISSFPFENFMRSLKSSIRKPQKILQQLANRMSEGYFNRKCMHSNELGVRREHSSGPVLSGLLNSKQYRELYEENFTIKLSSGDNCIMYDNKIALVMNICSDGQNIKLVVQKFKQVERFFSLPSTDIGIYEVSKVSSHFDICLASKIQTKYVLLPHHVEGKWIALGRITNS